MFRVGGGVCDNGRSSLVGFLWVLCGETVTMVRAKISLKRRDEPVLNVDLSPVRLIMNNVARIRDARFFTTYHLHPSVRRTAFS